MPEPYVLSALPSEQKKSIASLVTAFMLDPFMRWMLPEPEQYLNYSPEIFECCAGDAFDNATAYRAENFFATALWLPPGADLDEESLTRITEKSIAPALQNEVFTVLEQIAMLHPKEDYWYLSAIGVDPVYQGMGYGSALMVEGLKVCDQNHVAAYLESSNPQNIPLYQHFGFEIIGEIQAGSSPVLTPMLRAAR